MSDVNRLWVHVSCFGEGNLFAVYPQLLAKMLAEEKNRVRGPPDFQFVLPSDDEWKSRIYYKLVAKQREFDEDDDHDKMQKAKKILEQAKSPNIWDTPPAKRQRCNLKRNSYSSYSSVASTVGTVSWNVHDITKAASLMHVPPMDVNFQDEQEMRRVYSLIYDVFRYRKVLNQALTDISFFYLFPELRSSVHHVWLLLYDLYHRRFFGREHSDGSAATAERLFPTCGLTEVEVALWATRIRLAAALSRLRIANSALCLSDMLPAHLRDERVIKAVKIAPVTCWVNRNVIGDKISPADVSDEIKSNLSLQALAHDASSLNNSSFCWDPLCPMFLFFHHSQRVHLAQSHLVRNNILIMQNRSFCFGPAIFCKLLYDYNLTGSVIQTHVSSPKATAYFATLLAQNKQIYCLLVFGAGNRKQEYEQYFSELKIKNILVFAQRLIDFEPDATILEPVVAVFATPPNSYSAVNDPIDLVCSRGGDLSMLEILTNTDNSAEGRKRVAGILEEQRLTLRSAMTKPQIQFVLYETHSQLKAENDEMVNGVMYEVNRAAQYKHAELQGKIQPKVDLDPTEINNNEMELKSDSVTISSDEETIQEKELDSDDLTEEEILSKIEVPPTDSFVKQKLPDLCFNMDQCLKLSQEGCYLALIQRKEITRFDNKYMIKMAESRGLFGGKSNLNSSKAKQKPTKQKKRDSANLKSGKRRRTTIEIDRIAAQTHASMMRSCPHALRSDNGEMPIRCCPRHIIDDDQPKISPARLWWAETTKYLTRLRRSLLRQKLITNKPAILKIIDSDQINKDIRNIDEILSCIEHKKGSNIPLFPKLRLTRPTNKMERIPYPIYINSVHLANKDFDFDSDFEQNEN